MSSLRVLRCRCWIPLAVAAIVAFVPVSGCGSTTGAPRTGTAVTSSPTRLVPPLGTVLLTGAVKQPSQVTVDQLHQMPLRTVEVGFQNDKGTEHHTEVGVPLAQLIPSGALATRDKKSDLLSFAILGVGADGYQAAVSYGEISPDFANRDVLVAITEDGKPLNRPRLVVPGDVKGGRYVINLIELHVSRLTPA
jgi:hypothetical protein